MASAIRPLMVLALLLGAQSMAQVEFQLLSFNEGTWSKAQCRSQRFCSAKIRDVHCSSSDKCWGVGLASSNRPTIISYSKREKESSWRIADVGLDVPKVDYFSVHCADSNFCIAVGKNIRNKNSIISYNGSGWQSMPSLGLPAKSLRTVFCFNRTNCWAAGITGSVFYWNGKKWIDQSLSKEKGVTFHDIYCDKKNRCRLLGRFHSSTVVYSLKKGIAKRLLSVQDPYSSRCLRPDHCVRFAGLTKTPKNHLIWNKTKWDKSKKIPIAKPHSRGVYCYKSRCFMW